MIAHIEGNIVFRGSRFVIVEAGGIGYRVFISKEAMKSIPEKGSSVKFFTHLHTREDTMELYGFLTFAELEFFELLISISRASCESFGHWQENSGEDCARTPGCFEGEH